MKLRASYILVMSAMLGVFGCGGSKVWVVRSPQWDFSAYERVAVIPAKVTDARATSIAQKVTAELTNRLVQNRSGDQKTFTVLTRSELADLMKEHDLAMLDFVDPNTALPSGMIQVAQALIVPTVTQFDLNSTRNQMTIPDIRWTKNGPVKVGDKHVWVYENTANIAGDVKIVDVTNGQVVMAYSTPTVLKKDSAQNHAPGMSPQALAGTAASEVAYDMFSHIAPVWVEVKLDKECFVVATDYYDGEWAEIKKISPSTPEFKIAVHSLPSACDQNTFMVALTQKDGRSNIFQQRFEWDAGWGSRGITFDVPMSLLNDAGGTAFTAKLYGPSSEKPIMERDFEVTTD